MSTHWLLRLGHKKPRKSCPHFGICTRNRAKCRLNGQMPCPLSGVHFRHHLSSRLPSFLVSDVADLARRQAHKKQGPSPLLYVTSIILLLFALLHFQHNVCKFSSTVLPPLATGRIWSISSNRLGSLYVELPQYLQVKPSRSLFFCLNLLVIKERCSFAKADRVSLLCNNSINFTIVSSVIGTAKKRCAIPPPDVYANLYSTVNTLSLMFAKPSLE